jgi:hypothetical protein
LTPHEEEALVTTDFRRNCNAECVQLAILKARSTTIAWLLGVLLTGLIAANGWVLVSYSDMGKKISDVTAQFLAFNDRLNAQRSDITIIQQRALQHEREDFESKKRLGK